MKKKGSLIVFEGNDGAGKTTALSRIRELLEAQGFDVLVSREPGGNPIAEQIREILLNPASQEMTPQTEALLYAASRAQHLSQTILPAIAEGKIVLCDRFLDSSLAYQGYGRNLGVSDIEAINDFGLKRFRPDLTLFFSVSAEISAQRIHLRGQEDRLDQESAAFHQRVRDGFEALIAKHPERYIRIDGTQNPEKVAQDGFEAIVSWLSESGSQQMDAAAYE